MPPHSGAATEASTLPERKRHVADVTDDLEARKRHVTFSPSIVEADERRAMMPPRGRPQPIVSVTAISTPPTTWMIVPPVGSRTRSCLAAKERSKSEERETGVSKRTRSHNRETE